jgi:LmbE family N-acetylglucosaminyl deacetylase
VFGAGELIAAHPGAVVVTVFAAGPAGGELRGWDRDCGFADGEDVMRVRRDEDRAALDVLGARPIWLPFCDDQYGRDTDASRVASALTETIDDVGATSVAVPLGLFHGDHVLVHEAALIARARRPRLAWVTYEDAIYRRLAGDPVDARIGAWRDAGAVPERIAAPMGPASALKRRAVACYASQLRGLSARSPTGFADVFEPETYWRLR